MTLFSVFLLIFLALVSAVRSANEKLDFNRHVRPILADNCFDCHGPDKATREANLRMDTRDGLFGAGDSGPLIVAGKPDESELMLRVLSTDLDEIMPPPQSHRKLKPGQIAILREWIVQGAAYDEHWAFVRPVRAPAPVVSQPAWCRNDLDRFVLAHLDSVGVKPQPEAAPEILARRFSLTLTGLPLSLERTNAFQEAYARDADGAVSALADELLSSEAYGEHFAWSWMDAARYADTNGYQADGPRTMWRWRDWLVAALNSGMPFDEFTREMLAGDLLVLSHTPSWQSGDLIRDPRASDLLLATGFLRNHRYDTGSGTIPLESKFENAIDRMETVSSVWMGLTFQCARCHDHKFDPLPSKDYYSLLGFFDKVPEFGSALNKNSHPYIVTPTAMQRKELAHVDAKVKATRSAWEQTEPQIAIDQAAWETTLSPEPAPQRGDQPVFDVQRVMRGLKFQFAKAPIIFNGCNEITESLDPVKLCAGNRAWTVSFWFLHDGSGDMAIFSSVDEPERNWNGFTMDMAGGKLRVRLVYRWVNSYIEFTSRDSVVENEWHHVTIASDGRMQGIGYRASFNGETGRMILTHEVTNDNAESAGKANLILGSSPFLPKLCGALADLRFYDRTLTDEEIRFLAERRSISTLARIPAAQRTSDERAFLRHSFLERGAGEVVKATRQVVLDAEKELRAFISRMPTTMVMQETAMAPTRMRIKGAYDKLGEVVRVGTPSVLPPLPHDARVDRIALANWLTHSQHPLTARVAVNRLWQQLWGRGFVDSPENFGTQCARPEQALLDWLATEYIRLGWDTKALLKLMVTSATFRQSSAALAELWLRDPANRLLARGPRFRLPISIVRDQALAISGLLKPTIGGPPVLLEKNLNRKGEEVNDPSGPVIDTHRRTLYIYWKRNAPHPMLAVFDVADRNQCDVRVRRTNTPLQALVTLNEPGMAECARVFAERVLHRSTNDDERLRFAFRMATGRGPSLAEWERLSAGLTAYQTETGDTVLAWTAMANVLFNLDATVTLE